jgi:hypothetical protein
LAGRRLQLVSELVPGLARVPVPSNPANLSHEVLLGQTRAARNCLTSNFASRRHAILPRQLVVVRQQLIGMLATRCTVCCTVSETPLHFSNTVAENAVSALVTPFQL